MLQAASKYKLKRFVLIICRSNSEIKNSVAFLMMDEKKSLGLLPKIWKICMSLLGTEN